jgi:NAD(P)-dependent dehydrogenase (short-subunit alcohol dehydrogenase family)
MTDVASLNAKAQAYQCPDDAFRDKVILVTGAGDGIGRAVALGLASKGAQVVLLGRTQQKLEAVYDAIEAAGGPKPAMVPLNLELAQPNHYNDLAVMLRDEFGRLDGLLHNAAMLGSITPLDQYSPDTWQSVMQVNVNAAFYLTRAMLPLLNAAERASVVFTTSSVGRAGRAFWGAYAVSKFATEGMVQVLADELENLTRIRVNAINPGACATEMRETAYPAEDKSLLAKPEDLFPAYFYLLGDGCDLSGQSLDAQPPRKRS